MRLAFWRRPAAPVSQTRGELIEELVGRGFLVMELRLTDRAVELLRADPTVMDDYTYWCVHIYARQAYALVEGFSVSAAGVGGPWRKESNP